MAIQNKLSKGLGAKGILAALALALLLPTSCVKEEGALPEGSFIISAEPHKMGVDKVKLEADGNANTLSLKINAENTEWRLTGVPDWITASSTTGSADKTVTLSVDEFHSTEPSRQAEITLASQVSDWPISIPITFTQSRYIEVESVELNKTATEIPIGFSETLTAKVLPTNAYVQTVTWASSNTSVATVSSSGTITAVSEGTCTITATTQDGGKTASCEVTSVFVHVESVTLSQTSLQLNVGKTATLTATVSPANASNQTLTWSSSNTSVATVSNGTVTAKSAGSCTITATTQDGSKTASCSVVVVDPYNGHAYVDLGLPSGLKWATCNVGASSPEEYGDYFAWGETSTKSSYSWSTYKWCNGSSTSQTKYNTSSSYGTVDNKTVLELSDDAARANWGGSWRMPTHEEFQELYNNCTWTWTTQNGKNGYKVTSSKNGNSIFLPAAGYRYGSSLNGAGSYGNYWSASLLSSYPCGAWALSFDSGGVDPSGNGDRCNGQSVRPVTE